MVQKQVKWTTRAIHDKFDILEYWINRNKSKDFSEKLDQISDKALGQLINFPDQGKPSDFKNIRIKIVRSYLIYYLVEMDQITVVRIWDAKRDPKKFKLR